MSSSSPLSPTFYGHIASTQDALLLFESCLSGALNHVARRPHDRERSSLIKSGNVFIYEEHSSGIRRWTDGVPWSPSRLLGNFLVYRELQRPFPPGEKKRAMKRAKRSPGISKAPEIYCGLNQGFNNGYSPGFDQGSNSSLSKETERSLIGSLVDSYGFKDEGLVKKTVSVTVGGISHHLVSYYTVADVMNNKFSTPSKDPRFQNIIPRPDLITKQNFRTPIDEIDTMDRMDDRSVYSAYAFAHNGYDITNQTLSHQPLSLPIPTVPSYTPSAGIFPNYAMNNNSVIYGDSYASGSPRHAYHGQFVPTVGIYPPTKTENHENFHHRQPHFIGQGGPDTARSPIGPNWPPRRMSTFEQSHSIDSATSAISSASSDSKLSSDSGYSSQGFYGSHRDTLNPPPSYRKMSLPIPSLHTTYDRTATHPFPNMDNHAGKGNMGSMGNSANGHGHYLPPKYPLSPTQHWASAGTS